MIFKIRSRVTNVKMNLQGLYDSKMKMKHRNTYMNAHKYGKLKEILRTIFQN
jgi:hypothetical protein